MTGLTTGAISGTAVGITNAAAMAGKTIAQSAAVGGTASAIIGSVIASGNVMSTVTGAIAASVMGASVASLASSAAVFSGPLGCLVVGATSTQLAKDSSKTTTYTFDCWKLILHDDSKEPSNGKMLKELVTDQCIKKIIVIGENNDSPQFIVENIWDEKFRIDYVLLHDNQLAAHAVKI